MSPNFQILVANGLTNPSNFDVISTGVGFFDLSSEKFSMLTKTRWSIFVLVIKNAP